MNHTLLFILVCFTSFIMHPQDVINGKVTDQKGLPIVGANVYLEGTYDGATTDIGGIFSFKTNEIGIKKLHISFLSYETEIFEMEVNSMKDLEVQLKEDVDALDTVVINAGTFEASDNSKVSVLKPLDVVTTASAVGDVLGALQTLPGTSTVSEDGRLFVRGGSADETQIFIDGIRVFTPYIPTVNNSPTRGRYSPFLFDGITFSTGGYSAEYGEALSSVLLLNTIDEPSQEKTDIGLMSVGGTLGHTEKWQKTSLSLNTSYINLAPYIGLAADRNDWKSPYESASGEAVFRRQFKSGLFKFYMAFDTANFALTQEDINKPDGQFIDLNNNNLYVNSNYHGTLGRDWSIVSGISLTHANSEIDLKPNYLENRENSFHAKLKFKKRFSSRIKLIMGTDLFSTNFSESFKDNDLFTTYGFEEQIGAVFAESDIIFTKQMALKFGLRYNHYGITNNSSVDPRIALAYKVSEFGQASIAYGSFTQSPIKDVLKFNQSLDQQSTQHYILNYQHVNNGRIFRAEAYRKTYDELIKFNTTMPQYNSVYSNNGSGYAQGVDLFWRDNESIDNMDYWLSYSFLDSKRNHKDFSEAARPNFTNSHNLSAVVKYWVDDWKSQIGASYTFASGRAYNNPNTSDFMGETTKAFNSLSLNWAYLLSQQKILYVSVNNVLGFRNINGYQYADLPNIDGVYESRALRPAADQFFFIGFFWTISDDKEDNQLDNL